MSDVNEQLYHQILDSIDDLVLLKGPNSRIIWANLAFRKAYGMSLDDLKDLIDSSFNDPDYTQAYIRDDQKVFNEKKSLDIACEPIQLKSGEIRYFHTVKSPLLDSSGNTVMTVGISRDITEKKRSEEELAGQKEKMVLASKLSALGEISSGIAHEINNPLAIIQSFSEQLGELLSEESTDKAMILELANEIQSTAGRIAKIVKSLRSFSRDDSSDPKEIVSITSLIDQTLGLCGERFKNHGTELIVEGVGPSAHVRCHPAQISQVLLNLLNNAHDAIENLPQRWIRVSYRMTSRDSDCFHEISVEDSGEGIPKAVAEKIMNPFFTTKEVGKGTGLGLSISKGIIEAHGGELVLDQDHSHTRFRITIPGA